MAKSKTEFIQRNLFMTVHSNFLGQSRSFTNFHFSLEGREFEQSA